MATRMTVLLITVVAVYAGSAAQTVDEIVAKNIAARGGLQKIHNIRTLTITGKLTGPGMDAPINVRLKQPGQYRLEMVVDGKTIVEVFDNGAAWRVNPFVGDGNPVALAGADLSNIQDQADFYGPLVDYKSKGHRIELIGKQDVRGTPCYKLKIMLKTGNLMYQYVDAKTYLEIREELIHTVDGKPMEIEETVGDYKEVGGVLFAHEYVSNTKGSAQRYKLVFEKIELSGEIDGAIFKMPQAKPAAAKP